MILNLGGVPAYATLFTKKGVLLAPASLGGLRNRLPSVSRLEVVNLFPTV